MNQKMSEWKVFRNYIGGMEKDIFQVARIKDLTKPVLEYSGGIFETSQEAYGHAKALNEGKTL